MNYFTFGIILRAAVLTAAMVTSSFAQSANIIAENPLVLNSGDQALVAQLQVLQEEVRERGCNVNVCFALQTDDFISVPEFFDQVSFVQLVAAVLDVGRSTAYAAVQYSSQVRVISELTDQLDSFLNRMNSAQKLGGDGSNIAAALISCSLRLRVNNGDANKIVLFSDGFETTGPPPSIVADNIRADGAQICAVGVGAFSIAKLETIVDSNAKVTLITNFIDIFEIISSVVADICSSNEISSTGSL